MKRYTTLSLETSRLGFSSGTLLALMLTILLLAGPANAKAQTSHVSGYRTITNITAIPQDGPGPVSQPSNLEGLI